jgi:hypothetical protein
MLSRLKTISNYELEEASSACLLLWLSQTKKIGLGELDNQY